MLDRLIYTTGIFLDIIFGGDRPHVALRWHRKAEEWKNIPCAVG